MKDFARNPAPGELEAIRILLNTRSIDHQTRRPVDRLRDVATSASSWAHQFEGRLTRPPLADLGLVTELRADLRASLGRRHPADLQTWFDVHPIHVEVTQSAEGIRHRGRADDWVGHALAIVVDAVAAGHWHRLRACPGCDRVFFDRSKNLSRVWCGMYADGPAGRACGTIAKVAAYRKRNA